MPLAIPESANHIRDGWLNNSSNQTFIRDDKLQVGGWGDQYRTFVKFDIVGLPKSVGQATLWLYPYSRGDSSTPTPLAMCKVGSTWDTSLTWSSQPIFPLCWGWYSAPVPNQWWGPYITTWYNEWQSGTTVNNGVMFYPQYINNRFDVFRSSRYAGDGYRPILQLDFVPTLELKMPFNGLRWNVTTEIGGIGCTQVQVQHQNNGYFSIDFSGKAIDANRNPVYPNPSTANIPIIAAAGGTVRYAHYSSSAGNYVEVVHGATGITTRYLHMKAQPLVYEGQVIPQGKLLGYMGATGSGVTGVHLDFNVQYTGADGMARGSKDQDSLAKIVMDGWILKSFQVDGCSNGESGRYYQSSNVMIP